MTTLPTTTFFYIFFFYFPFVSSSPSSPSSSSSSSSNSNKDTFKCSMYLAESSIPNSGFGIYTTKYIQRKTNIYNNHYEDVDVDTAATTNNNYIDTPSIVVTDFYELYDNEEQDWNHVDYIWEGEGNVPYEAKEVSEVVMTIGSLCNFHTVLKNLIYDSSGYDDTILDRYKHPGAGAISYHAGRKWISTRDIQAGEELFVDYGEQWLDNREGSYADDVPRYKDYLHAVDIIQMWKLHEEDDNIKDKHLSLLREIVSVLNKRISTLLPQTKDEYDRYRQRISNNNNKNNKRKQSFGDKKFQSRELAKINLSKRDIPWIENNGICLEKIRSGISGIYGAGRGAFATMDIEKGEIISPAPLLNIPNIDSLLIYNTTTLDDEEHRIKVEDEPTGYQLLMNYCFGHKKSRLILCPQTNMILMNHCSDRESGVPCGNNGDGPNAKVRWATSGWDPTTTSWLNKSIEEVTRLTSDGYRGLSFEVIATKNIEEGDEVFIDYGKGWEDAWLSHVKNWIPPKENTTSYIPLGSILQDDDHHFTAAMINNSHPDNMEMYCYGGVLLHDNSDDLMRRKEIDGTKKSFYGDVNDADNLLKCEIVVIDNDSPDKYLEVRIFHEKGHTHVTKYPKKSIVMRINPYTSDQHLEGAFRHYLEIDDDIFPEKWIEKDYNNL